MDKERFIEQILETENLTDTLEDNDASWLLDWGIGKLDTVLQGITDRETAGRCVSALMAVMRKMNTIVGSYADKTPIPWQRISLLYRSCLSRLFLQKEARLPGQTSRKRPFAFRSSPLARCSNT